MLFLYLDINGYDKTTKLNSIYHELGKNTSINIFFPAGSNISDLVNNNVAENMQGIDGTQRKHTYLMLLIKS